MGPALAIGWFHQVTGRPRHAAAPAGPWKSRERLSHMRSVVAGDQQFVKTRKKTGNQPIVTRRVICVLLPEMPGGLPEMPGGLPEMPDGPRS
jgi:hypothetical protein